jgi:O-succinylbenzoic acid--CoA ligase
MSAGPIKGIWLHSHWFEAELIASGQAPAAWQELGVPAAVQSFLKTWFSSADAIVAHTSGSTGPPKAIGLHRDQMIASAQLTALHFGFRAGQKALLPLSADFIAGKMMLVRAMVSGLDLYTAQPTQRPDLLFPEQQFAFTPLVPAQLFAMLQAGASTAALGTLLLGGSDVSNDLQAIFPKLGDQQLWQGFGMTETVSHLALRQLHPNYETAYTPLPGLLVQCNEQSCLRVWGATTQYRWLQSNDVIDLAPDGSFRWLGRADNVINSGGHKIHPEQLEAKLRVLAEQIPELAVLRQHNFYISQQGHPQFGAVPVLVLEAAVNLENPALEQLQRQLQLHLASHEMIRALRFEPAFARTANGKLLRH